MKQANASLNVAAELCLPGSAQRLKRPGRLASYVSIAPSEFASRSSLALSAVDASQGWKHADRLVAG